MGEPAAAHAFLDGHLGITLPPETHARLTADHVQLAAVDHTRERADLFIEKKYLHSTLVKSSSRELEQK